MSQMGLTEFFSMEASEYLERLDALVSAPVPPDSEELLRLTRALRGSALMANQRSIATAAAAFETLARAVREHSQPWDEATRQLSIRAVDDLKVLVRSVNDWTDAAERRAAGITSELERATGRPSGAQPTAEDRGLDAGTRAFLAREGAAVASALHEAARSMQQNPQAPEPLERVLKVMQPLRGVAILSEIPPLNDVLQGVEQAVGEVSRRRERIDGADLLFEAAAKALSRAAREIAAAGRADPESVETRDFAHRLSALLELDQEAVPIDSLFFDDDGPHIVERGTATARPARLGRLELVSHGEHLELAADELQRAPSTTQRELRAQALAGTFRALASATGGPLEAAVSAFGHAAREAVARGAALHHTERIAEHLRAAGVVLSETAEGDEAALAERLRTLVAKVNALPKAPAPKPVATTESAAPRRPPAASAAFETEPTPSAAPAAPRPPAQVTRPRRAVQKTPAPGLHKETGDLVGSWIRYERYAGALGFGAASLDDLIAGPPTDPADDGGVAEESVVPIRDLSYRGPAALERALALREKIQAELKAEAFDLPRVRELIKEVFDLVELGRDPRP